MPSAKCGRPALSGMTQIAAYRPGVRSVYTSMVSPGGGTLGLPTHSSQAGGGPGGDDRNRLRLSMVAPFVRRTMAAWCISEPLLTSRRRVTPDGMVSGMAKA